MDTGSRIRERETYRFLAREDGHLGDIRLLLADIAAVILVPLGL